MKSGKRWIALIALSVLLATAMSAWARSPRPAKSREDLTLPSTSGLSVRDTQAHRAQIDRPSYVPVSTRQTARWGVPSDLNWFVNEPEALSASSALLMDADTGAILFARHHMERRSPASTTKIMTALLILEEGRLDDTVLISERAASVSGTGLGLRRGQRVVLRDLLWAILLKSANDAALAAAEHVGGGSEEQFVARMNAKAASLGMQGTQFSNSHGLDHPDHYSTAFDLAMLARQALRNPTFARMVQTREAQVAILTGRNGSVAKRRVIRTHNQLLGQFSGADGVKTGYTSLAGRCLVASATRGDHQLIAVLLNDSRRWVEAAALLEYGFAALGGRASSIGVSDGGSADILKGEGG